MTWHYNTRHMAPRHATPRHATAQHATIKTQTAQHHTSQRRTAQYRTATPRAAPHRTARHGTAQYCIVHHIADRNEHRAEPQAAQPCGPCIACIHQSLSQARATQPANARDSRTARSAELWGFMSCTQPAIHSVGPSRHHTSIAVTRKRRAQHARQTRKDRAPHNQQCT